MSSTVKSFFILTLSLLLSSPLRAEEHQDRFTFLLPAPALLRTLQQNLPLALQPGGSTFEGKLSIDDIDSLRIHDNIISLHGVLSGRDMSLSTKIAGRSIRLKLGQLSLPVSCDLHLRLDHKTSQLYIRPSFASPDSTDSGVQALLPLLSSLGEQEYPVDLTELSTLKPIIDGHRLNMQLKPVEITARENRLTIGLQPL